MQKEGGNNEIINHMKKALLDNSALIMKLTSTSISPPPTSLIENNEVKSLQVDIDYVMSSQYLPKFLPPKLKDLFRPIYLRNISLESRKFATANLIITTQPNSHCIIHKHHLIYFQHHLKQYYDLFGQTYKQRKGLRKKLMFLILTALVRASDRLYLTPNLRKSYVVVNSKTVGNRLEKYNNFFSYQTINPGCRTEQVARSEKSNQDLNLIRELADLRTPILLSFSRLSVVQKGIDVIVQSASKLPEFTFVIAGPFDPSIETLKSSTIIPSNVRIMAGGFSEAQKAALFDACDVFLAPYLEEDFGITPLEANGYGKPVVFCDDSGEIVRTQEHKQTGFMCNRNPESIASGIRYCIENKEKMEEACRENGKRFSWENFERSMIDYISTKKVIS
jgi:glycosyltransferase involved in cell wall biosynthesis